jgi:hypothetical protein
MNFAAGMICGCSAVSILVIIDVIARSRAFGGDAAISSLMSSSYIEGDCHAAQNALAV